MSNAVIKVTNDTLKKMKNHYTSYLKDTPPQGALFSAKKGGCTITGYLSGKILFQGQEATNEAKLWSNVSEGVATKTATVQKKKKRASVDEHSYYPPKNVGDLILLGSDETGTGDYFGPMIVACVHLSKEQMEKIDSWGVRDSKMINDETIRTLAPRLVKECTFSLLVLNNEKYNELQEKGMNQGEMKALMHYQAIVNVMKKCHESKANYDGILIDQFVQPRRFFEYLKGRNKNFQVDKPLYFATKAENLHPSVAAGSIIARYSFLNEMEKLEKKIGFPLPKGAGPSVDQAAKVIVQNKGKDELYRYTKWHFANTKKVLK